MDEADGDGAFSHCGRSALYRAAARIAGSKDAGQAAAKSRSACADGEYRDPMILTPSKPPSRRSVRRVRNARSTISPISASSFHAAQLGGGRHEYLARRPHTCHHERGTS